MDAAVARRARLPSGLLAAALLLIAPLGMASPASPDPGAMQPAAIEQAAALPTLTDLQMSPDGAHVMLLRPLGGATGVTVLELATGKERVVLAANVRQQQIAACHWASSSRIVCRLLVAGPYPRAGAPPLTVLSSRLVAVDIRTARSLMLDAGSRAFAMERFLRGALLAVLPNDPEHVLVLAAQTSDLVGMNAHVTPHVERVSLVDGTRTRVHGAQNGNGEWLADPDGVVRAGVVIGDNGARIRVLRDGDWHTAQLGALGAEHDFDALFIDARGERLIVAAHAGAPTRGVHEIDARTGQVTRTLHVDASRDFVGSLIVVGGEPKAMLVSGERLQLVPLADDWRELARELAQALPEQGLVPWSSDRSGRKLTVRSSTPHEPTQWYVYDREARKLMRIGAEHRGGQPHASTSRWVSFTARDGLVIPALLSLPAADAHDLPTIVIAHDGPTSGTRGDHDGLVAFLVGRGFAVLQPQYRGSYGFGAALTAAGRNPWSTAPADDLEDGLRWLRARRIADGSRACVIGHRYGGYLALQLASRPAIGIRCVAARTPLADIDVIGKFGFLATHLADASPHDPGGTYSSSNLASPTRDAGQMSMPLLLSRPEVDDVLAMHATGLLEALARDGKAPEVVLETGVDVYDRVLENRRRWITALDAFLHTHLAVDAPRREETTPPRS